MTNQEIMNESRTPNKATPIMRRVNPDFPGDGKPRFKSFGIIIETDEEFAERAGAQIKEKTE